MKFTRLVVVALMLSLVAACGSEITGPEGPPVPTAPAFDDDGHGSLGSGT